MYVELPSDWDESRQKCIGELVSAIVNHDLGADTGTPTSGKSVPQDDFLAAYPNLDIVPLVGDGSSCQFEAVGEAACGTPTVSRELRALAIQSIQAKWDLVGEFVKSEIAHQADISFDSLTMEMCCELLLGSTRRAPLWGNEITMAQLPAIVKKTIVVLTLSESKPFKHTFECEGATGTIYVGLVPEAHYFPVKPKEIPTLLKKGDKGYFYFPP